ncbi:MAG: hypothetical protein CL917_03685 [Deltaproteobacteria bacterium]|nr:hypothetical protein [Deltaproteobacteria bacterium]
MKTWNAEDKALLMVSHKTRLNYSEPVVESHSEVRKTPVDTGLQRVVTSSIKVSPNALVDDYIDYFGSHVHHFNILEPHDFVEILTNSVVETTNAISCGPDSEVHAQPWKILLAEFLPWSPAVPYLAEYKDIPSKVHCGLPGDDFIGSLQELGSTFKSMFRYDPRATDVHSSPKVLFEKGGGVCQDLAHAMLGVLRLASIPCRYVSGYVYDAQNQDEGHQIQGAAASHAWVQVWHTDLGWVGIDPTNDKLVDWQYIRVAVGRDYTDVQPLRGIFVGAPDQSIQVKVEVTRIG